MCGYVGMLLSSQECLEPTYQVNKSVLSPSVFRWFIMSVTVDFTRQIIVGASS